MTTAIFSSLTSTTSATSGVPTSTTLIIPPLSSSTSTTSSTISLSSSQQTSMLMSPTTAATTSSSRSTSSASQSTTASSTLTVSSTAISSSTTRTTTQITSVSTSTTTSIATTATVIVVTTSPLLTTTQMTTSSMTSPSTVIASTTTAVTCGPSPSAGSQLCGAYNHQEVNVAGSCYEIECSTSLQGTELLAGNYSTSFYNCIDLCNLLNLAIPYTCVGALYNYGTQPVPNCFFFSSVTGTTYTPGIDSGRLIYAGYSAISDPQYTTYVSSTTTLALTTTSASTTTTTTNTTPTSCQAAATASPVCPGISGQCFTYNYYGTPANFEAECGTQFAGTTLQPLVAFSLNDCVGWCQYDNVNNNNSCVGITFMEGEYLSFLSFKHVTQWCAHTNANLSLRAYIKPPNQ